MGFIYSCDILELLKEKGYTSYRMRKEKLISESALQKIREGKMLSWHELDTVCNILGCQPGDLIRHEAEKPEN